MAGILHHSSHFEIRLSYWHPSLLCFRELHFDERPHYRLIWTPRRFACCCCLL